MEIVRDLIFDVGVFDGADSAYYLHKGYRVVAVEANPLALPFLQQRFAAEIRNGRYELIGAGIGKEGGSAEFFVCDDRWEWSSFDRTIAAHWGLRSHAVAVPTISFRRLLQEYGNPYFCKIDIEGHDDLCLLDLTAAAKPRFVSVERNDGELQIRLLRELGYTRFKIISQATLRQRGRLMTSIQTRLSHRSLGHLLRLQSRVVRRRRDGRWRFPPGSSGPFGENSSGRWLTSEEALRQTLRISKSEHPSDWFDIHATTNVQPQLRQ